MIIGRGGQIFENFQNFSKKGLCGVLWAILSKFFQIFPFDTVSKCKTLIFGKKSENVSNYWHIFREKFGHIEQPPQFLLINAIKHGFWGSDRTTHSTKILGTPPNTSYGPLLKFECSCRHPFYLISPKKKTCIL